MVAIRVSCLLVSFCCNADLVLAGAEHGQVGLKDAGQQLALGPDLVVDELDVVVDVAKVILDRARDPRVNTALDRRKRSQQRVHGAVELGRLALQEVDALGLVSAALEDAHLGVLEVVLESRGATGS